MNNHRVPLCQAADDLGREFTAMTNFNRPPLSAPGFHNKGGPYIASTEDCARWDLQNIRALPNNHAGLHSVAIVEWPRRVHEICNDVYALFLYTKRGYLGEPGRLNQPHPRAEGMIPSPTLKQDRSARLNFHGVRRKDIDDDFQLGRVSQFNDSSACRYDSFALLIYAQYPPSNGRAEFDKRRSLALRGVYSYESCLRDDDL